MNFSIAVDENNRELHIRFYRLWLVLDGDVGFRLIRYKQILLDTNTRIIQRIKIRPKPNFDKNLSLKTVSKVVSLPY